MKKGKLNKILAGTAMGLCALVMPFGLVGCDKEEDINVRFYDNYFQWQFEGDDEWNNVINIDELKGLLGDGYKGDTGATGAQGQQGVPGIDGREVEFRTNATHIQWRYVGDNQDEEDGWKNLVELETIKGSNGNNGSNGSNGTNGKTPHIGTNGNWWIGETDTNVKAEGINGREVEFQTTETHIQWRYVGESEWVNLISFEEMQTPAINPNQEMINQEGYELFSGIMEDILSLNSKYKLTYKYKDYTELEFFAKDDDYDQTIYPGVNNPNLLYYWCCSFSNTGELYTDANNFTNQIYRLFLYANAVDNFKPTKMIMAEYSVLYNFHRPPTYKLLEASLVKDVDVLDRTPGYNSQCWDQFTYERLENCQTNGEGKYILTFNYEGANASNHLFNNNHIYKFYVSEDNGIEKCIVYEKDYLDDSKISDVYCSVEFEKDGSDFTNQMYNEIINYVKANTEGKEEATFTELFEYVLNEE